MTNWHQLTDEQLGIEIGSVIRERVESEAPPAGVFLSIQDRLGSQDAVNPLVRVAGWIAPSNWRLPMFTGTVLKALAVIVVAIAIVGVLVFQGRDSEDEVAPAVEPTATPSAQIEPTATEDDEEFVDVMPTANSENETHGSGVIKAEQHFNNNDGLTWDGETLWTTSRDLGDMYRISTSGELLFKQRAAGIPTGSATDGENLWVTDNNTNSVIRFDFEGNEIERFNFTSPSGIEYRDDGLWVTTSNKISRLDLDGTKQFDIEGTKQFAIGDGRVFSAESDQLVIYDLAGEILSSTTIPLEIDGQVHRIRYGENSVWVITEAGLLLQYSEDGEETARWLLQDSIYTLSAEQGALWMQVSTTPGALDFRKVDGVRVDLVTGDSDTVIADVLDGEGLVADGKYFHLEYSGSLFIVEADTPGSRLDRSILGEPVADEPQHPDLDLEWVEPGVTAKSFPDGLKQGSEPLGRGEVEALWTEALSNSQISMTINNDLFHLKLCGSGRGLAVSDFGDERYVFDWEVKQSVAGGWSDAAMNLSHRSGVYHWNQSDFAQVVLKSDENGLVIDDGVPAFDGPVTIFDYPECPA